MGQEGRARPPCQALTRASPESSPNPEAGPPGQTVYVSAKATEARLPSCDKGGNGLRGLSPLSRSARLAEALPSLRRGLGAGGCLSSSAEQPSGACQVRSALTFLWKLWDNQ